MKKEIKNYLNSLLFCRNFYGMALQYNWDGSQTLATNRQFLSLKHMQPLKTLPLLLNGNVQTLWQKAYELWTLYITMSSLVAKWRQNINRQIGLPCIIRLDNKYAQCHTCSYTVLMTLYYTYMTTKLFLCYTVLRLCYYFYVFNVCN